MNPQFETCALPNSTEDTPQLKTNEIETRTQNLGKEIFEASHLNIFNTHYWRMKLTQIATSDLRVKTQLFRFVDVLPALHSVDQKIDHLKEYLSSAPKEESQSLLMKLMLGTLNIPAFNRLVVGISDFQVKQMAKNFIVGSTLNEALPKILSRRKKRIGFTLDLLGEGVFSESEADSYFARYWNLIEGLGGASKLWKPIEILQTNSLGPIPAVNISVKISALDCRLDPAAFDTCVERLVKKLTPLLRAAMQHQIFLNFDMEQFAFKDIIRETFKRLILHPEFRSYPHWGIVVQAYLKSSFNDLEEWAVVAKSRKTRFTIRLVKGAYWDYETVLASQNHWECPVFQHKSESDAQYEICSRFILENYPHLDLAAASHNIRSIAYVMAYAEYLKLPPNAYEVQMLYGMADAFKGTLVKRGVRLREYDPVGEFIPGLSYLVRRLLENTSNDSFLRQSFMDRTGIESLLRSPVRRMG